MLCITSQASLGLVVSKAVGAVSRAVDKTLGSIALSTTGIARSACGRFVYSVVVSPIWASFVGQHASGTNELLEGRVGKLRVGASNDAIISLTESAGRTSGAVLTTNWAVNVRFSEANASSGLGISGSRLDAGAISLIKGEA